MSDSQPLDIALALFDLVLYFHLVLPILLLIGVAVASNTMSGLTAYLDGVRKTIDFISRRIGHAASWLSLFMVLIMFAVVVMRYVFGIGFIWLQESVTYMHAALFMLAAGFTLLIGGHVRVDVFYREARPHRKALVDLLGTYLLLFPVMFLILDVAFPYVEFSWAVQEGSKETSGIHGIYLLKTLILVFAWTMILQGLSLAIQSVFVLIGVEEDMSAREIETVI